MNDYLVFEDPPGPDITAYCVITADGMDEVLAELEDEVEEWALPEDTEWILWVETPENDVHRVRIEIVREGPSGEASALARVVPST